MNVFNDRGLGCLVMRLLPVIILFIYILASSHCIAATYVNVGDDIYAILSRLEAEGAISSGLLTSKPISRREAIRLLEEAENKAEGRSAFMKSLVQDLRERIRPEASGAGTVHILDSAYLKYVNANADVRTLRYGIAHEKDQALNFNNDGDLYGRVSNARVGFTSRVEDVGRFSFFLNPEFRVSENSHSDLVIKNGYAVFDFGWDLIAGRESQWWGPGYHGALLLTNNAEPFTMVKIANPSPVILPWVFKYLGPFGFTFFATQLEKDRADAPEPYLWGMRMNFKPHKNIEIGLQRTALLGGEGRPTNGSIWFDSITGRGEHGSGEAGDQRAGYDLKLTLPFEFQPVQVYLEAVGEDGYHKVPSQWAYLYGLYLPRLLSLEPVELRIEWARTDVGNSNRPSSFYVHHIYTSGYTHKGLIIGHHIGTDSRDVFTELTYRFPEKSSRVSLAFDRMRHNVSFDVNETVKELSIRTVLKMSEAVDLDLTYGYAWIKNAEFVPGVNRRNNAAGGTITRRF